MKKFVKLSAVLAAITLALAFTGCSSDDDDDDEDELSAVTSAQQLKFQTGTYSFAIAATSTEESAIMEITGKGTVMITGTSADSTVATNTESSTAKITAKNKEYYDSLKEEFGEEDKESVYTYNNTDLVITAAAKPSSPKNETYAKFTQEFFPKNEISSDEQSIYTGIEVKQNSDGSKITASHIKTDSWTDEDGKKQTSVYKYSIVLEKK